MPTKKPIIQTVLDKQLHEKLVKISEIEKRSKSQITAFAIEKYIKDYEAENGTIEIHEQ